MIKGADCIPPASNDFSKDLCKKKSPFLILSGPLKFFDKFSWSAHECTQPTSNDDFFDENASVGSLLVGSQHTCADDINPTKISGGIDMIENDGFFDENAAEANKEKILDDYFEF